MNEKLTQAELAEVCRVTPRTIRNWAREGLPRNRNGSYSLRVVVRWYVERRERDAFRDAQIRLTSEQADRVALANATRRDALGDRALWKAEIDDLFREIRTVLRAMPARVAPLLTSNVNQRKEHLERIVREILSRLATYGGASR